MLVLVFLIGLSACFYVFYKVKAYGQSNLWKKKSVQQNQAWP